MIGCGGGTSTPSVIAPSNLTYSTNPAIYTRDTLITNNTPSSTGGAVVSYSVSPALPMGLSLNTSTGVISGTPSAITATAGYAVTATNTGGSTTASVSITVNDVAPSSLTYSTNPAIYTRDTLITNNTPSSTGGAVVSYSVSPVLPAGLSLNTFTGIISGTPMVTSPKTTYTITASNSAGQTTTTVQITVIPLEPPSNLTYPQTTIVGTIGQTITTDTPTVVGIVTSFSISPGLPPGLSFSTSNGAIYGTPTVTSTQTTYTITATNSAGSFQATIQITVKSPAFLFAQEEVLYGSHGILASVPPQEGATFKWTLVNGAANVIATSGTTGNVISYNTESTTGTYQITVDVKNPTGEQTTQTRTLNVVNGQFLKDVHSCNHRNAHTATLLTNGRTLLAGGSDAFNNLLASAELYDPSTRTWSATGSMAKARLLHTATLLANGQVLVVGGMDANNNPLTSAELYDPIAEIWHTTGSMINARNYHTANLLTNGKVLVTGGTGIGGPSNPLASAELYDPATGTWSAIGNMAISRFNHTSTNLADGRVLVTGGKSLDASGTTNCLASAELFEPLTGTWSTTGRMADERFSHTTTLLANGQILVVGGANFIGGFGGYPIASAELYDSSTRTWSRMGSMANVRAWHTASLLTNGMVLAAGGNGGANANEELYDPSTRTWSNVGRMANERSGHTATLQTSGQVLISGGSAGVGNLASPEIFDPQTHTWSSTGSTIYARIGHTATLLADGKVLVAGGSPAGAVQYKNYLANSEMYDPSTGYWSLTANQMTQNRLGHTATRLSNGTVLVTGGGNSDNSALTISDLFDPSTQTWSLTGFMTIPRSSHTSTLLPNGQVLVTGGSHSGGIPQNSAELYNPSTGMWSMTGSMAIPREAHTATLLSNGKVLVAGGRGYIESGVSTSVELYDLQTGSWTTTASMSTGRNRHTATLLANGKVLVTGGFSDSFLELASAELYDPQTGTWSVTGSMTIGRMNQSATLLPDGSALVTGGFGSPGNLSVTELYNPLTGTWSTGGSLVHGRVFHTTTLLSDGSIMVVGGSPGNIPEKWKP